MSLPIKDSDFGANGKLRGGYREAAKMLQGLDPEMREKVIHFIEVRDPETAKEVRLNLVLWEDLQFLTAPMVAELVRAVNTDKLALGLRISSDELQETIFSAVSEALQEELKVYINGGPVKKSEVVGAQHYVLTILRDLIDDGKISIDRDKDPQMV